MMAGAPPQQRTCRCQGRGGPKLAHARHRDDQPRTDTVRIPRRLGETPVYPHLTRGASPTLSRARPIATGLVLAAPPRGMRGAAIPDARPTATVSAAALGPRRIGRGSAHLRRGRARGQLPTLSRLRAAGGKSTEPAIGRLDNTGTFLVAQRSGGRGASPQPRLGVREPLYGLCSGSEAGGAFDLSPENIPVLNGIPVRVAVGRRRGSTSADHDL